MSEFRLPDLGEGLQEAEIIAWHVSPGDHVVAGQPIVSVETAKAVVDIPSPQSGRIAHTHGNTGETLPVGAILVEFEDLPGAESAGIVGDLEEAALPPTPSAPEICTGVKISPVLRLRARQLGVDVNKIAGTGPDGAITSADLEAAVSTGEGERREVLRSARRTMAIAMASAGSEVVAATVTEEADISSWPSGTDVTVRLVRAIAAAATAEPRLNAWYDAKDQSLTIHSSLRLGLAIDTADGLFVPVLKDPKPLSDANVRNEIARLRAAVLDRRLAPDELRNQTITLSNFGMIAGLHASLVVMPPQVCIIGAGRILTRAVLNNGTLASQRLLPLSLSFDHRAITGGEAARFLKSLVNTLQSSAATGEVKS